MLPKTASLYIFGVNMIFIQSNEVKKCILHEWRSGKKCIFHEWRSKKKMYISWVAKWKNVYFMSGEVKKCIFHEWRSEKKMYISWVSKWKNVYFMSGEVRKKYTLWGAKWKNVYFMSGEVKKIYIFHEWRSENKCIFHEWRSEKKMYVSWVAKPIMKYIFFHFIQWNKSHIHSKNLNIHRGCIFIFASMAVAFSV